MRTILTVAAMLVAGCAQKPADRERPSAGHAPPGVAEVKLCDGVTTLHFGRKTPTYLLLPVIPANPERKAFGTVRTNR